MNKERHSIESGFLYFILAEEGLKRVKIGVSSNPVRRLKAHQVSSPIKLSLHGFIKYITWNEARSEEQKLHKTLKQFNLWGEWFEYNAVVEKTVTEMIHETVWSPYLDGEAEKLLCQVFSE